MTLFEYLAIAFGLLFSIAALRLLGGLPYAVQASRRYGPHLAMSLILLIGTTASFWTFWSLHDVEWTFPRFLLALAIPGALYFSVAMLVPENPEDIESWQTHYYAVRVRLYSGMAIWGLAAAISASVNLSLPINHPARFFQGAIVGLSILGATSSSPKVHRGIVIAIGAAGTFVALTVGARAGWLAR